MTEDEHDRAGYRLSPLETNGGIGSGAPASSFVDTRTTDSDDGQAIYTGQPTAVPLRAGREYDPKGHRHPPVYCDRPRIASSWRGYYHCPACATKVRLASYQTSRERADEIIDRWGPVIAEAIRQVWVITVSVYYVFEWVIRWLWWRLTPSRAAADDAGQVEQDTKTGYDLQGSIEDQQEFMTHDLEHCRGNCIRHPAEGKENADVGRDGKTAEPGTETEGAGAQMGKMEEAPKAIEEVDRDITKETEAVK